MIDARDLRIGNFIYWNIPNKIEQKVEHEVTAIIDPTLHTCPISLGRLDENGYLGIQITEKWLIRLGFVYDKTQDLYSHKSGHELMFVKDGYIEFYLYEYGGAFKCVEYVHQLQNLYKALTNEELEIK